MIPAIRRLCPNLLVFGLLYGCVWGFSSCGATNNPVDSENEPTISLLPDSTLVSNCYDWPGTPFSRDNNTGGLRTSVVAGDTAIDFTLMDVDSTCYSLSSLLQTKPVLMVFGAYT
ncbi:hypothetical protein ACFL4K_02515 [Candidatus Neomarinimicrobiota bacterium]